MTALYVVVGFLLIAAVVGGFVVVLGAKDLDRMEKPLTERDIHRPEQL